MEQRHNFLKFHDKLKQFIHVLPLLMFLGVHVYALAVYFENK